MNGQASHAGQPGADPQQAVRGFIVENMFLGADTGFGDDDSLLEAGALDSTAAMELVAFLETAFGIQVTDAEIAPENLETVARICAFVERKRALQPAGQ
jgi:acyl carrier protein